MKTAPALLLLIIISCKSKEPMKMPGVYNMISQRAQSGTTDTSYTSRLQLKIFTEDFMMYSNVDPSDSSSSFGIGSYTMNGDTLIEKIIYTSSDSTFNDSLRNFTLLISKTGKGYKQVIPEMNFGGTKWTLTEDYESKGTGTKSALDGAWKLAKGYTIRGTDTVVNQVTQYKTYYSGYCIWGNTFQDSAYRNHTGIGYGKFEMKDNKVKEMMSASTYSAVSGHDFNIDIDMKGTEGFTQTITNTDGSKSVEIYERMKKM